MEPFSYSNSDHVHDAPEAPAPGTLPNAASALGGGVPDPAKAAQPAPQQKPATEQQKPGPQLGDGVPEAVRELREQRRQETPFHDETKDYQHIGLEESADAAGLAGEERDAVLAEQRRMLADFQFDHREAREVVRMVDTYAVTPPDAETEGRWANEAWTALVRQHGAKEANVMLLDAQKLVARDPRVKAILEATRLGNHPVLVAKLVSLARSERGRGRLK